MHARFTILTAALLTFAGPVMAAPASNHAESPAPRPQQRAEVVLASADQSPAADPQAAQPAPPVKHRVARVTTCRCGDQQADSDEQDQ